ncbi:hypothetical protein [Sulfurovum sp.]|uniref:hypothetical protein n=1 Tax=Sulfurovum sp. TaxID=1969726 RepID=UPI0025EFC78D|nr:hypothetical protein [Sulfurovum sp.]
MKRTLVTVTLLGLGLTGCTNTFDALTPSTSKTVRKTYEKPTAAKLEAYNNMMRRVASGIKNDPNYNRIALDTPEKKAWFKDLTYRLWDRQINKYQFVAEGLRKYPTHKYEFEFVVRGFNS